MLSVSCWSWSTAGLQRSQGESVGRVCGRACSAVQWGVGDAGPCACVTGEQQRAVISRQVLLKKAQGAIGAAEGWLWRMAELRDQPR